MPARLPLRPLLLSLVVLLGGCAPKGPAGEAPIKGPQDLDLPPVPATVASIEVAGQERPQARPARVQVVSEKNPLHLRLEDFGAAAEVTEVIIESEGDPARFGQVPGATSADHGSVVRDGSRLRIAFDRRLSDGASQRMLIRVDRAPVAVPPPEDWLRPGTVLHYGLVFDDKPITRVVPMALTVRLGAGSDGSRLLSWHADIDPHRQQVVTGERTKTGRKMIPATVAESGTRLDDRFARGEDIADANSLFLSREQLRGIQGYGGASLHDEEVGPAGVLVRAFPLPVKVQADDVLWEVPSLSAWTHGGDGIYVVADDPDEPLILSARRPGYTVKLLAIDRP